MALKYGDRGTDVVLLQQALIAAWKIPVGAAGTDGIFGKDTKSAVQALQKRIGAAPDGVVSAQLAAIMGFPRELFGTAQVVNTTLVVEGSALPPSASRFDWRLGLALGGLVGFGLLMASKKGRASFTGVRAARKKKR